MQKYWLLSVFLGLLVLNFCLAYTAAAQTEFPGFNTGDSIFGGAGDDSNPVTLQAEFSEAKGDAPARLFITATIKAGWHIYSITQSSGGPIKTEIKLSPSDKFKLIGDFKAEPKPKIEQQPEAFPGLDLETHAEKVTWHAPIKLAPGADPAALKIEGTLFFQPCDDNNCLPPRDEKFTAGLGPGVSLPAEQIADATSVTPPSSDSREIKGAFPGTEQTHEKPPIAAKAPAGNAVSSKLQWRPFSAASFKQIAGPNFDIDRMKANLKSQQSSSLGWQLLFGFLGGLILNIMPCVLPVIGLKVLSFIEQSSQNRWNTFALNLWYSAGLISVFLLLASLAVFANLGWGQLFQYSAFNVALAAIVFVMGLSFLGVWEIPIPGFIGSGKSAELSAREGASGAFIKGVITTILATPCTGPFMATAIAWAVAQPPVNTYLVFFSVGLGMASPYLLIGAFPALIRFLPKPGAWMDTFKQIMGFVLLGTVVYIFTFLDWSYIVPSLGLLIACWAACWWIGRTPLYAEFGAKARTWFEAVAFVGISWIFLFPGLKGLTGGKVDWGSLHEVMSSRLDEKIDWQIAKYLDGQQAEGYELVHTGRTVPPIDETAGPYTVLIDFTADWCATCKFLEATVLHSEPVREKLMQNGVVLLKGDCTNYKEVNDANSMLKTLGAGGVPTIAIFPAKEPNSVILFRGAYTQQAMLKALDDAGPSKSATSYRNALFPPASPEKKELNRLPKRPERVPLFSTDTLDSSTKAVILKHE
jgi:suppressor for copper-sensitivity B